MKICAACGEEKPLSDFGVRTGSSDGLNSRCVACARAASKASYEKTKARIASSKPADCKRKTADIVAYRKAWAKAHPGYHAKKRKEWSKLHPGADEARWRLRYEPHPKPVLSPKEKAVRKTAKNRKSYIKFKAKADRYAAKLAVKAAINAGRLVALPCAVCGKAKTQGHHPDYSEPLSVIWLCQKHHIQLHREFRVMLLRLTSVT